MEEILQAINVIEEYFGDKRNFGQRRNGAGRHG
jgi:hypothetical protein